MLGIRRFLDGTSVLPLTVVFTAAFLLLSTIVEAVRGLVIDPLTTASDTFSGGFFGAFSGTASIAGREVLWRRPAANGIALALVLAGTMAVARRRQGAADVSVPCPWCAAAITSGAAVCGWCQRDVG